MSLLGDIKEKRLKYQSERLTKKLAEKKKQSALAEGVAKKQKQIDKLNTNIKKASPVNKYYQGLGTAAKKVYANREKIGTASAKMGANILGEPAPVQKKKKTEQPLWRI